MAYFNRLTQTLGIGTLGVQHIIRIGKTESGKSRPTKVVFTNKQDRKKAVVENKKFEGLA